MRGVDRENQQSSGMSLRRRAVHPAPLPDRFQPSPIIALFKCVDHVHRQRVVEACLANFIDFAAVALVRPHERQLVRNVNRLRIVAEVQCRYLARSAETISKTMLAVVAQEDFRV